MVLAFRVSRILQNMRLTQVLASNDSCELPFGRRNLINYQRSVLALELESNYSERAKENQTLSSGAGVKGCQKSDNLLRPNSFSYNEGLTGCNSGCCISGCG